MLRCLLKNDNNKEQLGLLFDNHCGKKIAMVLQSVKDDREFEETYIDLTQINMTVEIDEEQ